MENINPQGNLILKPSADWKNIPLGVTDEGDEVFWDTAQSSSALLSGTNETGSERSIVQRSIILHCLQHLDKWQVLGLDLKKIELTPYSHFGQDRVRIASGLDESFDLLRDTYQKMNERYLAMEKKNVIDFKELGGDTRSTMVVIDSANLFMSEIDDKERKNEIVGMVGSLARMGRATGINLLVSANDSELITKNKILVRSIGYRIVTGQKIAIIQKFKKDTLFRKYHAPEQWFEDFLLDQYLAHKQ